MVAAADAQNYAQKLALPPKWWFRNWAGRGHDDDIRSAVEETIGGEMVDEESDEVMESCCCGGATATVTWSTR